MSRLASTVRRRSLLAGLALGLIAAPGSLAGAAGVASAADAPVTSSGTLVAGISPARSLEGDTTAPHAEEHGREARRAVPGAVIGDRTVLVLRVHYGGEGWPSTSDLEDGAYSAAEIQSRITAPTGSAKAMYAAQSGGQLVLKGKSSPNADVHPSWLTFAGQFPRHGDGSCNADAAREQVKGLATKDGIPWNTWDHVVLIFPALPTTTCGWSGLGEVPGKFTWINGLYEGDELVDAAVIAHEMGHNLGLAHAASLACTQPLKTDANVAVLTSPTCSSPTSAADSSPDLPMTEYGDPFDMMGTFSYGFLWRGTELLSSWRRAQALQLSSASQQTVTKAGTYALLSATAASGTRLIRISRGPNADEEFAEIALEYRPSGATFDRWSLDPDSPPGGVLVRLTPELNTSGLSYLLDATPATRQNQVNVSDAAFKAAWRDAALRPGRTLLDDATKISVKLVGISGTTATVQLSGGPLGALPTATPTPTPTPTPTATPTPTPVPTAEPTPTPPPANVVPLQPLVVQSESAPLLAPSLISPAARKGVRKLAPSRKVTVSFPGAGRVTATIGSRWSRTVKRARATFELPKTAVRTSTVKFRASGGSLAKPRTASLRIRQGVLRFTVDR